MAKKKASVARKWDRTVQVQCGRRYKAWLGLLCDHTGQTLSVVFERAVAAYAKKSGLAGRPPDRGT